VYSLIPTEWVIDFKHKLKYGFSKVFKWISRNISWFIKVSSLICELANIYAKVKFHMENGGDSIGFLLHFILHGLDQLIELSDHACCIASVCSCSVGQTFYFPSFNLTIRTLIFQLTIQMIIIILDHLLTDIPF